MALAVGVLVGACIGVFGDPPTITFRVALVAAVFGAMIGHRRGWSWCTLVCATTVFVCGEALLAEKAREDALASPLRAALDAEFGGFQLGTLGPEGVHPPIFTRGVLTEDASNGSSSVLMRVRVLAVRLSHGWVNVDGAVGVSVAGTVQAEDLAGWRAGTTIVAPIIFRRPARYLNPGVPDFERALAMSGTTLFGSVKSGLVVDVETRGSWWQERAADTRALVRRAVRRWVGPHSEVSAAIVAAILIGDRTGLPDEIRERLQAAGVYHVLAISGGNIAILVSIVLVLGRCLGLAGTASTLLTMGLLLLYAQVVVAGPSVFRAVMMALVYLAAQVRDHRTPAWQAIAVAVAVSVILDPLDIMDAGFLLTFAATGALLAVVPYAASLRTLPIAVRWTLGAMLASAAAEAVLLPIGATVFGRVTALGIVVNLVAIPLMTAVQLAGLALSLGAVSATAGEWAGWVSHLGASALVESARLADVTPWLSGRVPQPPLFLVCVYYAGGTAGVFLRGMSRCVGGAVAVVVAGLIVSGAWLAPETHQASELTLTMFDVGQGEAMHVAWPGRESMVIDTGGAPFAGGNFNVGDRVLRPALWAQGVRSIERLLITHGDPDHIGGAPAVMESFAPLALLEGIPVVGHAPFAQLRKVATRRGAGVRELRAGDSWAEGGASVRVLHPEPPDWERRRVRNDDSVVLEVRYGDVAILLLGDAGVEVERAILPRLSSVPVRVLKVGHHGSRTSTSAALIDSWKPQVALISCGRGNRFGHPAPEVVARLDRAGVKTYRTDRDGAITLATDGRSVRVRTFLP